MVHFPIEFHVLEIGSVEKKKICFNKWAVLPLYANALVLPDGNECFPSTFSSGAKDQGRKLKEFAISLVATDCCLPGQLILGFMENLPITCPLAALPFSL